MNLLCSYIDELIKIRRRRGLTSDWEIASISTKGLGVESTLLENLKDYLCDEDWNDLPNLIRIRLRGQEPFTKEDRRKAQEQEEREALARIEKLRREKAKHDAIDAIRSTIRSRFLHAESLYEKSYSDIITPDEFASEKSTFVRNWLLANLPTNTRQPDAHQLTAIAAVNGSIQVVARAGSGKTTVLVYRTLFLLKHCGVPPEEILLLAFNRKAVATIRRRLLSLLRPESDSEIKEWIGGASKRPGKPEDIESEAVDKIATQHGILLPHVLTFHALAHAIVHPEERLLFDDRESGAKVLSSAVQQLRDDYLRTPEGYAEIRAIMSEYFRADWEDIIEANHHLNRQDLLNHRRSIPRRAIQGHPVKSFGEKVIADFLFEHGLAYTYERNYEAKGFNYKPDFTIYSTDKKNAGVIIEYFGMKGDADYDAQSEKKKLFWKQKAGWPLLDFYPADITRAGVTSFRNALKARLEKSGISCHLLTEDEIWDKIKDRAVDRFSESMNGFIGRCRKLALSVDDLRTRVDSHTPMLQAEGRFLTLGLRFYSAYLERLKAHNEEDFNGLLLRAARMVESGTTEFSKRTFSANLTSLRYIAVDEFQDFSELFHRLLLAIRKQVPNAALFCVGDDWQAINGFAGSDLRFFQNFSKHIGPARRILLPTNYRSVTKVVDSANLLMHGLGEPAGARQTAEAGAVLLADMERLATFPVERDTHGAFDKFTPAILRVVSGALRKNHPVVVLFRTNTVFWSIPGPDYPLEKSGTTDEFLAFLRSHFPKEKTSLISVSTTHQYKGLEKAVVVIADATEDTYPLIHPTWLFSRVFGDTLESLIAEERRLFYVAITRAEEALVILTEGSKRSPFLETIAASDHVTTVDWDKHFNKPVSRLDKRVILLRNATGRGEIPTRAIAEQLKASRFKWDFTLNSWAWVTEAAGLDLTLLQKEPWSLAADGVEVSVENSQQAEIARYAILDGGWSLLHGDSKANGSSSANAASPDDSVYSEDIEKE